MKPSAAPLRCRCAFTLVELLVVIGIIAVLISILLPTLRRARESANKAHCLSNLHQIGIYLQMYQNQYKGQLPIYVLSDPAYLGYFIYSGTSGTTPVNDFTGLGLLVPANVAPRAGSEQARVFYCPTADTIATANKFNYMDPGGNSGWSNPWAGMPGYTTRMTYTVRPEYWTIHAAPTFIPAYPCARWDVENTTKTSSVQILTKDPKRPCFPRAGTFSRKSASAIVMDLNANPLNRAVLHRGASNALYANWSAKTIPNEYVQKHIKNIEGEENSGPNGANTKAARWAYFQLWRELDRF
jgi:prepilin-type N-terminal cleavage/methylation domain-containing protein